MFCRALLTTMLVCTSVYGFTPSMHLGHAVRRSGRIAPAGLSVRAVATPLQPVNKAAIDIDLTNVQFSGLKGVALEKRVYPNKKQVMEAIPAHCFKRNTLKSMMYATISLVLSLSCMAVGWKLIPLTLAMLPVWMAYAAVTGTVATGCWVIAHECGHGAFSDNKFIQDAVGYLFHTMLLVPYFSWQRSHAVHHAFTNHMTLGETHVPYDNVRGEKTLKQRKWLIKNFGMSLGGGLYAAKRLFAHLVFGWPAYLMTGVTGGPVRGITNHFWPIKPFSTGDKNTELFPGAWKKKVWLSDVGIVGMLGALGFWVSKMGFWHMAAIYGGPLMVANCWLVLYTWLQHTDVDVPHWEHDNFNFIKGAFMSIDRPYGPLFDFLHHRIGSTHVVHHIDCTIPHYRALEATKAVQKAFPDCYLYEPTPLPQAMWRVARDCVAVEKRGDRWVFTQGQDKSA
mmetsp:Transcript_21086/g.58102  ORF Transcript_21086/g.58102 Transcript_21086/m.58102 type:complete len:451 (-) Transcript_21086:420-1772(-)